MKDKVIIFIAIIGSLFFSCGKMEPYTNVEFVVDNTSKYNVELEFFRFVIQSGHHIKDITFSIPEKSEIKIIYLDDMGSSIDGFPIGVIPDSVFITFNNVKRIVYRQNDLKKKSILDITSYSKSEIDEHNNKYTYSITDEDYENAIEIIN